MPAGTKPAGRCMVSIAFTRTAFPTGTRQADHVQRGASEFPD